MIGSVEAAARVRRARGWTAALWASAFVMLLSSTLAIAAHDHAGPEDDGDEPIPLFPGLGRYHRAIGAASERAQAYFDQGMMLAYAFGRPEAARSFRAASQIDPDCAICYWGEAWALGPYQNETMSLADAPRAHAAIQQALQRKESAGEVERALIEAMASRYVESPQEERAELDRAYADAMKGVAARFPEDRDVLSLYAESLMVLHPWDLYPGGELRAEGAEAISVLEDVLSVDIQHPGACHFYIHAVEESTTPERAEACADVLAAGIPLGSHIQHMPSHIYMRIGRYGDAVRANQQARVVDGEAARGAAVAIYPGHNTDMLCFAAWMDGQSAVALQAARDLGSSGRRGGMMPLILARFGRWEELLEMDRAPEGETAEGMWLLARGLAFLRTGAMSKAKKALNRLEKLVARADPEETFGEQTSDGPIDLLRIARGTLAGEIAAAAGDPDEARRWLESAVDAYDGLEYSEPEIWPIPPRQVLGAILLDAGHPDDARRVYQEELDDHPENGWSLFGLAAALRALGRESEADDVQERFEAAWARADVSLASSRF